jgi:hypothetical protein
VRGSVSIRDKVETGFDNLCVKSVSGEDVSPLSGRGLNGGDNAVGESALSERDLGHNGCNNLGMDGGLLSGHPANDGRLECVKADLGHFKVKVDQGKWAIHRELGHGISVRGGVGCFHGS